MVARVLVVPPDARNVLPAKNPLAVRARSLQKVIAILQGAQPPRFIGLLLDLELLGDSQEQSARKQGRCHGEFALVSEGKLSEEPVFAVG